MQGLDKLLAEIEAEKVRAVNRWGNGVTIIAQEIIAGAMDWLFDNLELKSDKVVYNEDLPKLMNDFVESVIRVANESQDYKNSLTNYLESIQTIQSNITKLQLEVNAINIEKILEIKEAQRVVVNEIINQYTDNGLNAHFASPLRDLVYRNALAGMNMKQAKAQLQEYILGGQDKSGKLGSYLTQTAQQGVDSYTGITNMILKRKFKMSGFIISGSLIETSSKQCIYAVDHAEKGFLPNKEWEKVLDIARNNDRAKLIAGTTLENLPLNKLHWGCRHEFTPKI